MIKGIKIKFVLYMFVIIFAPPLVPRINSMLIISVFTLYMLLTKYKYRLKSTIERSGVREFTVLFLIAAIYVSAVILINELIYGNGFFINYATTIYRYFFLIPAQLINILYIIIVMEEYGYTLDDFWMTCVFAAVIQGIIGVAALLFPELKAILIDIMHFNTGSTSYFKTPEIYHNRFFGFSGTLLDTFGFGMGLLFVLSIYLAVKKNWKLIFAAPLILISILLNARTGLIVIIIGLLFLIPIIYIYKIKNNTYSRKTILSTIFICVFSIFSIFYFIYMFSPQTIRWIQTAYIGIASLLKGEGGQYAVRTLFSEQFWTFPNGNALIFGSGHTVYGSEVSSQIGIHSDVGYINDIWLGGIIGMVLSYIPFIYIFVLNIYKAHTIDYRLLQLFVAISFFVVNIKFITVTYNPGMIILLAISFLIRYFDDRENRSNIYRKTNTIS